MEDNPPPQREVSPTQVCTAALLSDLHRSQMFSSLWSVFTRIVSGAEAAQGQRGCLQAPWLVRSLHAQLVCGWLMRVLCLKTWTAISGLICPKDYLVNDLTSSQCKPLLW